MHTHTHTYVDCKYDEELQATTIKHKEGIHVDHTGRTIHKI